MRSAQETFFLLSNERPTVQAKVNGVLQFSLTITQLHLTSKKRKGRDGDCSTHIQLQRRDFTFWCQLNGQCFHIHSLLVLYIFTLILIIQTPIVAFRFE